MTSGDDLARLRPGVPGTMIDSIGRRRERVMPTDGPNNVSPLLLPGVILGGVLLLIGGITTGSVSTVILALVVTAVLTWTIVRRNRT
jgi:hypothetical protein